MTKVTSLDQLFEQNTGQYLFFPGDGMHISEFPNQEHKQVLEQSGFKRVDVSVAGGFLAEGISVIVDGLSSSSLVIERRSCEKVTQWLKKMEVGERYIISNLD